MTGEPLRDLTLPNGLRVRVYARTRRIAKEARKPLTDPRGQRKVSGDIWVVGFLARATADVEAALAGEPDLARALEILGSRVEYERELMRNLVPESEKAEKEAEIERDLASLLSYLSHPAFPARLIRANLKSRAPNTPSGPWSLRRAR